jgi:hypothetical protein
MPIYYFNIRHGAGLVQDIEGVDLADFAAVEEEALRSAQTVIADRLSQDLTADGLTIEVAEQDGTVVAELPVETGLLRRILDPRNQE